MKKTLVFLVVLIALAGMAGLSAVHAPYVKEASSLELSKAIGTGTDSMMITNVNVNGTPMVARLTFADGPSLRVVPGSATVSEPPTISNLIASPSCNPVICSPEAPQFVEVRFDFSDPNGDIMAGSVDMWFTADILGSTCWFGGLYTFTLFPLPYDVAVIFDTQTTGHVIIDTCWGSIDDVDMEFTLVDGAGNPSQTLTTFVNVPPCFESSTGFVGMVPASRASQSR